MELCAHRERLGAAHQVVNLNTGQPSVPAQLPRSILGPSQGEGQALDGSTSVAGLGRRQKNGQ